MKTLHARGAEPGGLAPVGATNHPPMVVAVEMRAVALVVGPMKVVDKLSRYGLQLPLSPFLHHWINYQFPSQIPEVEVMRFSNALDSHLSRHLD